MPYATQTDITDLYGLDALLRVSDLNKNGVPDPEVVQKGLKSADEICDAYLSARYTVPVAPVPGVVRNCAVDIALYKMALGPAGRTGEMRQRYEDALELLQLISTGKVGLGQPPVDTDGDGIPDRDPNFKSKGRFITVGRC